MQVWKLFRVFFTYLIEIYLDFFSGWYSPLAILKSSNSPKQIRWNHPQFFLIFLYFFSYSQPSPVASNPTSNLTTSSSIQPPKPEGDIDAYNQQRLEEGLGYIISAAKRDITLRAQVSIPSLFGFLCLQTLYNIDTSNDHPHIVSSWAISKSSNFIFWFKMWFPSFAKSEDIKSLFGNEKFSCQARTAWTVQDILGDNFEQ